MTDIAFRRAVSGERTSAPAVTDPIRGQRPSGPSIDADGVLTHTSLESRADIDNLDELQSRRRALVKQYAPLAAKFRGGQVAGSDAARKRHRAMISNLILRDLRQGGEKDPSEAALERMANADERHVAFCKGLEDEFADFIMLENEIADVTEQVRNREECLRAYRAELNLEH
jgi:hypothetical protein